MRVVLAVLAVLAVPAPAMAGQVAPAAAAPSTCQGLPATITSDGGPVIGTSGDDVISTAGLVDIDALGGNDTVCVQYGTVDAGAGNDSVQSTATYASSLTAHLGDGDDKFTADAGHNVVDPLPGDSAGRDAIAGGTYDDRVFSGVVGEANQDVVDLGAGGSDSLSLLLPSGSDMEASGGGAVPPGYGSDVLYLNDPGVSSANWAVDLDGQVRLAGNLVAVFDGFSEHGLALGSSAHIAVAGTPGGDHLTLNDGAYDMSLGSGEDTVVMGHAAEAISGHIRGGGGADALAVPFRSERLGVDLKSGEVRADSMTVRAEGFQNLYGGAPKVRVKGDNRANAIRVVGCDVRVDGRGGRDFIAYGDIDDAPSCTELSTVFLGGPGSDKLIGTNRAELLVGGSGNDLLTGFAGKDVLLGGPDRDRAVGGKGKDRCKAEVERECES